MLLFFLILVGIDFQKFQQKEKIHYHAGFQVYVNGKKQDFSSIKYMNMRPCSENEKDVKEDEQMEKAHLHDLDGDVVHVEAKGAKWRDLFANIHFYFDQSKPLVGYVNGNKVDSISDYPIESFDSIVIFSGKLPDIKKALKERVTQKRIKEVGNKSESCGSDEK